MGVKVSEFQELMKRQLGQVKGIRINADGHYVVDDKYLDISKSSYSCNVGSYLPVLERLRKEHQEYCGGILDS